MPLSKGSRKQRGKRAYRVQLVRADLVHQAARLQAVSKRRKKMEMVVYCTVGGPRPARPCPPCRIRPPAPVCTCARTCTRWDQTSLAQEGARNWCGRGGPALAPLPLRLHAALNLFFIRICSPVVSPGVDRFRRCSSWWTVVRLTEPVDNPSVIIPPLLFHCRIQRCCWGRLRAHKQMG